MPRQLCARGLAAPARSWRRAAPAPRTCVGSPGRARAAAAPAWPWSRAAPAPRVRVSVAGTSVHVARRALFSASVRSPAWPAPRSSSCCSSLALVSRSSCSEGSCVCGRPSVHVARRALFSALVRSRTALTLTISADARLTNVMCSLCCLSTVSTWSRRASVARPALPTASYSARH